METSVRYLRGELGIYLDENHRTTKFEIILGILDGSHFRLPRGLIQVGNNLRSITKMDVYEALRAEVPS